MPLKPSPGPAADAVDSESELTRSEQELAALEGQLAAELEHLKRAGAKAEDRLHALRSSAAKLREAGGQAAPLRALERSAQAPSVPAATMDALRERALGVRRLAIEERTRAAEELRRALQAAEAPLRGLVQQLVSDQAALKGLEKAHSAALAKEALASAALAKEAVAKQALAKTQVAAVERTLVKAPRLPSRPPPASGTDLGAARTLTRRPARYTMQAGIDLHSESNFFRGFSTNLSEGGLFVATLQMLPRGAPVDLQFTLPEGEAIRAKGVVAWTRENNDRTPDIFPGVGVQFTELSPEAASAIQHFFARREPLFFPDSTPSTP